MSRASILVVDDEKSILAAVSGVLSDEGYEIRTAESGEQALELIRQETPDLVLLDIWMPGMDGLETLTRIHAQFPDVGIIMISGHGTIETAVRAIRLGAINFIEKPLSLPKLVLEVQKSLELVALEMENRDLKLKIGRHHALIGSSRALNQIRSLILTAGPSNARVMISGQSGTGKELVARAIHAASPRIKSPFIEVNCAAIPEDLIESELFGHEKGAFTNATYQKKGKFETAHGGTLFLDEIGDMSLKTQAKVLRVLEENRIERVGGNRSISVDVRVIAASNKNLREEIEGKRFREDLFYRLNVIPIHVPALREHIEDAPELISHFLTLYCSEYGKPQKIMFDEAVKAFQMYAWPGNIRELRNEIERLVIMTPGNAIQLKDLSPNLTRFPAAPIRDSSLTSQLADDLKTARENFEKNYILKRLEDFRWNITQTADSLGIERSNLHRKLKQLGIYSSGESTEDDE